jgi:hypothetical protein
VAGSSSSSLGAVAESPEAVQTSAAGGRSKVAQMAAAWASGDVVARDDGTVVNEPAESTADSISAKPVLPTETDSRKASGVQLGHKSRPGMVARSALQPQLPATVESNSARESFSLFLDATDLPEMRSHFYAAVKIVGLEHARGDPNFYIMLRSALLPKLNFKQKAIFKVCGGRGFALSDVPLPLSHFATCTGLSRRSTPAWSISGRSICLARCCPVLLSVPAP